ncbi:MAG: DUF58 domain-containing protein [Dongiaceae bacterium]
MTAGSGALRNRAEALAARVPPLLVAAHRIAATVEFGEHGRRRVGQGETFWQFRRYQPGDATSAIDWRQSAKADPVFVRETEWAAAQSIFLWCDRSPSMHYRSDRNLPEKSGQAELLTLALAILLLAGGERVALLGAGMRPTAGRSAIDRIARHLLAERDGEASLPLPAALPRHAELVLIGDFLSPLPEIERSLARFAEAGLHGHILQLLDPAEETLPFLGRVRFEGLETEGELLLGRVEMVRDQYRERFETHCAGLADLARAIGWSATRTTTDRPPQAPLLALHRRLTERPG